jgi:hypothetical protein
MCLLDRRLIGDLDRLATAANPSRLLWEGQR